MKRHAVIMLWLLLPVQVFAVEPVSNQELEIKKQQLQQEREQLLEEIVKLQKDQQHYRQLAEQKRRQIEAVEQERK